MSREIPLIEQRTLARRIMRKAKTFLQVPGKRNPEKATGRNIGVGLIGTGNVARWAYVNHLQKKNNGLYLAAIFDVDQKNAALLSESLGVRAHASLEACLSDEKVEAVCVCTPPRAHFEAVMAALDAGKHVLCEKPLAENIEEAMTMWDAAKKTDKVHMVHFSYRFRPEIIYMAQLMHAGVLGDIYHVWGTLSQGDWFTEKGFPATIRPDAADWRFKPGGGVGMEMGPHLIDLFRFFFGEISEVQAWTKSFRPGPVACDDACGISLAFESGTLAHMLTSRWITGYRERSFFEISGSKGTLTYDQGAIKLKTRDHPDLRTLMIPSFPRMNFLDAFYRRIIDRSINVPDFWDGLKNNEILHAIYQSAESREAVSLPFPTCSHALKEKSWHSVER